MKLAPSGAPLQDGVQRSLTKLSAGAYLKNRVPISRQCSRFCPGNFFGAPKNSSVISTVGLQARLSVNLEIRLESPVERGISVDNGARGYQGMLVRVCTLPHKSGQEFFLAKHCSS